MNGSNRSKFPQGKRDVVLAAEQQAFAHRPSTIWGLENLARFRGIGLVCHLQVLDFLEREVADLPAHDGGVAMRDRSLEPGLEHPADRCGPSRSSLSSASLIRRSIAAIAWSVSLLDSRAVGVGHRVCEGG